LIKRLLYTCGEPAGIGPDIALLYTQQRNSSALNDHQLVTIADPDLLTARAKKLGLAIKLKEVDLEDEPSISKHNECGFIATKATTSTDIGKPSTNNAKYILETLDTAIVACQQQKCHGMVTGPIQKSILNDAGIAFSGHTEYLAEKTNTQQVVMMLATEGLRVALATTHLPLNKVSAAITQQSLSTTIRILHHDLRVKFGINTPHIIVCGLNPHAGEGGHLGREEIDIIIPVLQQLAKENINCQGPLPADTLFTPKYLQHADAVLAMYHDQGLPVLKYKGFGTAANITLGLPIIRTSVDHGTALDLAGTGKVNLGSLSTAINYALQMNIHQDFHQKNHFIGSSNE
jgi:4-hydroxythreonine-4-phosphate dehydrogenase